jgi:hypothetical protein
MDEFNNEQQKHRQETKTHYNDKVEDIIHKKLVKLIENISESKNISDQDDLESTKIGQAAKNKSMVVQKMEDELKARVLKLATTNY